MEIPFVGGSYKARSNNANAQRCVNLFPATDKQLAKHSLILVGTPGTIELSDIPSAIIPPPIPPLTPFAGLRLDDDQYVTVSTLASAPALINGDTDTPIAASWTYFNSYGIDMGEEMALDGLDVYCYVNSALTMYSWGADYSLDAYWSNDNATWTYLRRTMSAPVFEAGPNKFHFRFMFNAPVTARYFKVHNADNTDTLNAEDLTEIEITEMIQVIEEEVPAVVWSETEQHPDFGGAFTNPIYAFKPYNTIVCHVLATTGKSSGKWYFEVDMSTTSSNYALTNGAVGIRNTGADYTGIPGNGGKGNGYLSQGRFYRNGSLLVNDGATLGWTYARSYIIGVFADLDNHNMWFSRDGLLANKVGDNGDPETGTDPAIPSIIDEMYYPAASLYYSQETGGEPEKYTSARFIGLESYMFYYPSGSSYSPWDS